MFATGAKNRSNADVSGLSSTQRFQERNITYRHDSARGETAAHSWAADIGPRVISTVADNDPSGIVTYSVAGAQFGYDLLWTCVPSYPLIVALQLVSARIARLTGKGLTTDMREHYSRIWFFLAVARFLIANTFNIAADVVAMGVAAQLLWHGSVPGFAAVLRVLSATLQWFVPYPKYARVLRWLALSLFAYGVVDIAPGWNRRRGRRRCRTLCVSQHAKDPSSLARHPRRPARRKPRRGHLRRTRPDSPAR